MNEGKFCVAQELTLMSIVLAEFMDGRKFRVLTVADDCTRECPGLVAYTSLSGLRVARELDRIIEERGKPSSLRQSIRDAMRCCAAKMAPHRNPPLPPHITKPKAAEANSKLDRTLEQGLVTIVACKLVLKALFSRIARSALPCDKGYRQRLPLQLGSRHKHETVGLSNASIQKLAP